MQMTTSRLILLRLFNVTLGRSNTLATLLKRFLTRIMITQRQKRYVATSRWFDLQELEEKG